MPQEWIFFPLDSETCYPTRGSTPFFASRCWGRGKKGLELEGKRCGHWLGLLTSKYVTLFCFTVGLFSLFCWKGWTSGAVWPLAVYTEWLDLLLSFVTMRVFLSFFVSLFTFCVRCLVFPRRWLRRAFCLSACYVCQPLVGSGYGLHLLNVLTLRKLRPWAPCLLRVVWLSLRPRARFTACSLEFAVCFPASEPGYWCPACFAISFLKCVHFCCPKHWLLCSISTSMLPSLLS